LHLADTKIGVLPSADIGHGADRTGQARIAVLPAATGAELGAFLKADVATQSDLLIDGFAGDRGGDAGLGEHLKQTQVVQGEGANAGEFFPIIPVETDLIGIGIKQPRDRDIDWQEPAS
jgi:hypothetical protein